MQFIEIIFQNPFNNELFWKFSNFRILYKYEIIETIFQNPFNNELFWTFSNSLTFPWLLPLFLDFPD